MRTYTRDEFDAVPESPRRQGVHRTRGEEGGDEPRRGLRWILAAGLIALVIGAAAFFLLPRLGLTGSPSAAATPSTAASATPSPAKSSAAPSQAPSSAAPQATSAPPAAANKALEVGVYNATGTAGLGTRVATAARTAGWTVSATDNWGGAPVNASVVFYKNPADAASAKALATDVGIANTQEAPALGIPLAVVIGPGYAG